MKKILSSWNVVMYDLNPVFSPGQRMNKYAIMIMLHSSWMTGPPNALVTLDI